VTLSDSITLLPVSIVLPCGSGFSSLAATLYPIAASKYWPSELLIVDSRKRLCRKALKEHPLSSVITLIEPESNLFPGAARNLGIQAASTDWILFLDINTTPSPQWLVSSFNQLSHSPGIDLFTGLTLYKGNTLLKRLFIDATYGDQPVSTVPGSIVRRSIFKQVGCFLPDTRAGEDTDWLIRTKQFSVSSQPSRATPLTYTAISPTIWGLARKWYRNYRSCAPVVFHLESQKIVYSVFVNILVVLAAFHWNARIANWDQQDMLYIANITKGALMLSILSYIVLRGLLMPLRRGTKISNLLPIRFLGISIVCFILDVSKSLAFLHGSKRYFNQKPSALSS